MNCMCIDDKVSFSNSFRLDRFISKRRYDQMSYFYLYK